MLAVYRYVHADMTDPIQCQGQGHWASEDLQITKNCTFLTGSNYLKGVSGKVIVDEKGIKDSWKEYMEKLMNEGNE